MVDPPDPATLLDLAGDKVVVLDENGIYRHLNASVDDMLGYGPEELVGTSAFELIHPDDEGRAGTAFAEVITGERSSDESLEYRHRTASGDWVWLRTEIHMPNETGLDGYVLTSRDVTKEVESRRRLETIASASSDVFWMFSADWSELLFVNDAVETVFDVPIEALEREPRLFLDAIHPDDRPYVERAMERLSAGESTLLDYRLGTSDGPTRWVRVPAEPVIENGEVVAVTGFARDVTDEYRRERQLAVMDNLLRHTIRNDMNVVDGTAERIADRVKETETIEEPADRSATDGETADGDTTAETPAAEDRELAADLVTHAETIRRVADNLLTTAEKQRGVIELLRQRGSPRPVDIRPVVEAALDIAIDEMGAGHDVSVSCPDDVTAFTHPELDYAIAELIRNAIEHGEAEPVVDVDVAACDETVDISIRDNCPTIPAEERHVITDRWEMDDLHHTGGMGLWLVYWIADRSGGELTFDTHENGNVVTVTVPNAECETALDAPRESTPAERSNRAANRARERIETARGARSTAEYAVGSETNERTEANTD